MLVIVKVCAALVLPTATLPKASGFGDTVALETAAAAVPVSETGEPVTVTLPGIVSVPVTVPVCVVGENTTLMVQVAGATNVAPQVPPAAALANGAVKARVPKVNVPVPVAVTVTGCDGLVVPSAVEPNVSEVGATLTANVAATPVPLIATGAPVTVTPVAEIVSDALEVTAAVGA